MRIASVLSLVLCLLTAPLGAQCGPLVNVPESDPSTGTCNSIPFGSSASYTAGYTYLSLIPGSSLDSFNNYIEDIAFASCSSGNWSCNTVIVGVGHVPNPLPATFNYPTFDAAGVLQTIGSFNDLTLAHNSFPGGTTTGTTTSGPFSWNLTQDTWSPMGFSATGGTGFFWNGVDDVAFFVTYQGSVVTSGGSFHRNSSITKKYGSGYNRTASASSSASALNLQLTVGLGPFIPGTPAWQCNQTNSSVDINGAVDPGPSGPMVTETGVNSAVSINLGGLSGMPWEMAITAPEGGVPLGGGGIAIAGPQVINVDLTAPSLFFLYNLGFANSFVPLSIPANSSTAAKYSMQMVVLDPAQPSGTALSHLNELEWVACSGSENYDLLSEGLGSASVGWSNPGAAGTRAWTVKSGGTSSSGTGPGSAFNGPNYAYCETSGQSNTVFTFDTCPTDVTVLTAATLSFELSGIGATIGTLNIYEGDGSGTFSPTPIFSSVGAIPGQSQGGIEWTNQTIPLALGNPFVNFRFEYTAGGSFTGDLAVDDIQLN